MVALALLVSLYGLVGFPSPEDILDGGASKAVAHPQQECVNELWGQPLVPPYCYDVPHEHAPTTTTTRPPPPTTTQPTCPHGTWSDGTCRACPAGQVWITGSGCQASSGCSSGNHNHDGHGCHSQDTAHSDTPGASPTNPDGTQNSPNEGNSGGGCDVNGRYDPTDPTANSEGCVTVFGDPSRCGEDTNTVYDEEAELCISTDPNVDPDFGDRTICPDPRQYHNGERCVVKSREDDPDRSQNCPAGQAFYSTLGCAYPCDAGQILVGGTCQTVQRPNRPQRPGDPPPPAQCPVGYSGTPPNCVEGTPEIYVIDQSVGESDGSVGVILALSHRAATSATVEVATSDGTATDGSDYTAVARTVTIPANTQMARVPVTILNDTHPEPSEETFTVSISNAAGGAELGASTSGTMTIVDDDPFAGILTGLTAVCVDGEITVSWQRPGQAPGLNSYSYRIADNINLFSSGAFYRAGNIRDLDQTSVTVAATDTSLTYHAGVRTNLRNAWAETDRRGFGCTESLPVVSLDDAALTVAEGSTVQITASLNKAPAESAHVWLAITEGLGVVGTCTSGADFGIDAGRFIYDRTTTTAALTLTACDDADTDNESGLLSLTTTNIEGLELGALTTVRIAIEDDDEPTVSISGPSGPVTEEDADGLSNLVAFTVELDPAAAEDVTVMVNTAAGTASDAACVSGGDFLQRSMTVRFSPGDTSKSFNVRTCVDAVPEHDEDFTATISSPTNAVLGTATTATATIRDNDEPTVSISAPPAAVLEDTNGVPNTLTFAVTLDVAGVQTVTVVASTSSGTATGGSCGSSGIDFVSQSATITFTAGDTSEDFTVATCADTIANEGVEDFTVSLSSPTNAALGTSSATGQIVDDDTPPIYR